MSDCEAIDETIQEKIQNLVVFMCNECGQGSANTAGVARMAYEPAIRIIRVQCTGQVGPIQIMDALNNGADAVACVGCCLGACHFFNGNILSMHRIKLMKKLFMMQLNSVPSIMPRSSNSSKTLLNKSAKKKCRSKNSKKNLKRQSKVKKKN